MVMGRLSEAYQEVIGGSQKVILYAPPVLFIDPQAKLWRGTYEKRVNEVNPIGRIGSIRQRFGTKSPHFKIEGELNFENFFRQWNRYFINILNVASSWFYNPESVKYVMEYLYEYDLPIVMNTQYDMSIVTIDRMEWEQRGDNRMKVKYSLDLYEVYHIPIAIKYPLQFIY